MTAQKIVGLLISLVGILFGATFTVIFAGLILAFRGAEGNPGQQGNIVLGISALIAMLIGFGIYKLGRKIAG